MTTWSKAEPGVFGEYRWAKLAKDDTNPMAVWWNGERWAFGVSGVYAGDLRLGPRIPSPETIEAAKDALREADGAFKRLPWPAPTVEWRNIELTIAAALAKLEGRS